MKNRDIDQLIERYASGEAGPREVERIERLAASNPDVARMVQAERRVREVADLRQAELLAVPPPPSAALMDMLRRTPPVPAGSGQAAPSSLRRFPWLLVSVLSVLLVATVVLLDSSSGGDRVDLNADPNVGDTATPTLSQRAAPSGDPSSVGVTASDARRPDSLVGRFRPDGKSQAASGDVDARPNARQNARQKAGTEQESGTDGAIPLPSEGPPIYHSDSVRLRITVPQQRGQ